MTIDIEYLYQDMVVEDYKTIIERVVEQTLDYEDCPYEAQVYVLLTDNEEIHEVNREQRQIDKPTDVLSFPMADYPVPGDFEDIEDRDPDAFHPETGELMLGDILISMDKVKEQAALYGHSATRELAFLVAHSMLHLMGYDHMDEEERLVMEKKQKEILDLCGYPRTSKADTAGDEIVIHSQEDDPAKEGKMSGREDDPAKEGKMSVREDDPAKEDMMSGREDKQSEEDATRSEEADTEDEVQA